MVQKRIMDYLNQHKVKRILSKLIVLFILFLCLIIVFIFNGTIWIGEPSGSKYAIRGVDVSHYQGKIDWTELSRQNIKFAFIKATEGSKSIDKLFLENWENIEHTSIKRGAYHFFSFDSDGKAQAENFISVVPLSDNMLPPVVDIEFYGDKESNKPDVLKVHRELDILLETLEDYYGQKPIIYTTMKVYILYINDYYDTYPLWIRNIYYKPFILIDRKWMFWQYTDKKTLTGYKGNEKYIDMNIFNGDLNAFNKLYNMN